ncbi:O-antigen ligase family protein [Paenibacillus ferrarius]|uniref:O-antigen ligase family protein n=1 Tax=Paenibacillus ferrarius TaxID=1469647 RepID=UPI003D2807F5
MQESLAAAFRVATSLPLFLLTSRLSSSYRLSLMKCFVVICSLLATWGILQDQFRDGRFEGPFEYANAWGIVLLVGLIVSIMIVNLTNQMRYLWLCSILTAGVVLTGSRTVVILLLIAIPIQYLAFGKSHRRTWAQVTLAIAAGGLASLLLPLSKSFFFAALALILVIQLLFHKKQWPALPTVIASAAILSSALLLLGFSNPTSLQRFKQLGIHASEWTTRLGYYRDAWSMIKDAPLLGYGGGAWNILQYRYQTAAYTVAYVHNHVLETWIETGIAGVLLLIGTALAFLIKAIGAYKDAAPMARIGIASYMTAFGCLFAHSLVDFTFSYPLLFGLWVMLGVLAVPSSEMKATLTTVHISRFVIASMAAMTLAIFAFRIGTSEVFMTQAEQIKDAPAAIAKIRQSIPLAVSPATQHTRIAYLSTEQYLRTHETTLLDAASQEVSEALALNPDDVHSLFLRCQIAYAQGDTAQAKLDLQELIKQYPFRTDFRTELARWN